MYPAGAIANALLEKASAESKTLTHLQLQKLVYIAHGWHLAVTGEPLIVEPVQAWTYGPVIPKLYDALKEYGREPVTTPLTWWDEEVGDLKRATPNFPPQTEDVVERVWQGYKHFNGLQLSTLTHQKETPWYITAGELPEHKRRGLVIPEMLIRRHFVTLGQQR